MNCPKCGYAMTDFDLDCPRCQRMAQKATRPAVAPPTPPQWQAAPISPPPAYVQSATADPLASIIPLGNKPALTAYYLGLFCLLPFIGPFMAVAAVWLGIQGLRLYAADPKCHGRTHAWVGIIGGFTFGGISTLLTILFVGVMFNS